MLTSLIVGILSVVAFIILAAFNRGKSIFDLSK